jgi:hypothetical protein
LLPLLICAVATKGEMNAASIVILRSNLFIANAFSAFGPGMRVAALVPVPVPQSRA